MPSLTHSAMLYLHFLLYSYSVLQKWVTYKEGGTKTCKYERASQGQAASFVWSPDIFVSHIIDPNCRDCQWALIIIITVLPVLRFDDFKLFRSLIIIIDEQAVPGWTPLHNQWDIIKILMLQRIIDLSEKTSHFIPTYSLRLKWAQYGFLSVH